MATRSPSDYYWRFDRAIISYFYKLTLTSFSLLRPTRPAHIYAESPPRRGRRLFHRATLRRTAPTNTTVYACRAGVPALSRRAGLHAEVTDLLSAA